MNRSDQPPHRFYFEFQRQRYEYIPEKDYTTPFKLVVNNILELPEYLIKPVEMTVMTKPVLEVEIMYGLTDVVEPFTTIELFMARETSTLGTDSALYPMHVP